MPFAAFGLGAQEILILLVLGVVLAGALVAVFVFGGKGRKDE